MALGCTDHLTTKLKALLAVCSNDSFQIHFGGLPLQKSGCASTSFTRQHPSDRIDLTAWWRKSPTRARESASSRPNELVAHIATASLPAAALPSAVPRDPSGSAKHRLPDRRSPVSHHAAGKQQTSRESSLRVSFICSHLVTTFVSAASQATICCVVRRLLSYFLQGDRRQIFYDSQSGGMDWRWENNPL